LKHRLNEGKMNENSEILIYEKGILNISLKNKKFDFNSNEWVHFSLKSLNPIIYLNKKVMVPELSKIEKNYGKTKAVFTFKNVFDIELNFERIEEKGVKVSSKIKNNMDKPFILNKVIILGTKEDKENISFGKSPSKIRIMENGNCWSNIYTLSEILSSKKIKRLSDICWLVYNSEETFGLLIGFLTAERWLGQIETEITPNGKINKFNIGFDGGDLLVEKGEKIDLEEFCIFIDKEPLKLLNLYSDIVKSKHNVVLPEKPPVSWCSWYPYRLGVSEERVLENAKIASERLKPLGLSIFEVDLGWEKDYLPNSFEENEQFPNGLKYLSEKLEELGFKLGVWIAPYTVSEFSELFKENPEYLIKDEKGNPISYWTWFWFPHGKVYILDLTHPGAQKWLKEKINSLRERGVKYLKCDFISCAISPLAKKRYNKKIVFGGGVEASRIGAKIIKESLPDALILNVGGPELPGKGMWQLLYTCNDTGNTGFLPYEFHRKNFLSVGCHLFKNYKWGILQPSCLCVGLPGTLEEARIRATIAFFTGGQIDISDNLLNLPEERWEILTKTLPPLGITATPIDLFEPIVSEIFDYSITSKRPEDVKSIQEHSPGSVWHIKVKNDWDDWDIVAIFELEEHYQKDLKETESGNLQQPKISRFTIPLEKLNLKSNEEYWVYEFWSGQFLGIIPYKIKNPKNYIHPGDYQSLVIGNTDGCLDVAFFGPAVKIISLRKVRPHPWIVGTSFHQSVGSELKNVIWDEKNLELKGEIHRPKGEIGYIVFVSNRKTIKNVEVDGKKIPLKSIRKGANGGLVLPILINKNITFWRICFD